MHSQMNARASAAPSQRPVDDEWELPCASIEVLTNTDLDTFERVAKTQPVLVDGRRCWPRDTSVLSVLADEYGHRKLSEVRTLYGSAAHTERSKGLNAEVHARIAHCLATWTLSDYLEAAKAGEAEFYLANLALQQFPEIVSRYRSPDVGPKNVVPFEVARAPELFVGSSNTQYSNLHVDSMGGSVWCVCLEGEKEWVVFPPSDSQLLCPFRLGDLQLRHSLLDPWNKEMCARFLLEELHPYRVRLKPGQALFLPPNWWHVTRNHGLTITINERLWSWSTLHYLVPWFFAELRAKIPGRQQPYILY